MMKKIITMLLICSTALLVGCAKDNKTIQEDGYLESVATDTDTTVTDATSVDDPTTAEQVDTEDATTVASNEDEDTTDSVSSGHATTENRRDDDSDSPSKPTSTTEAPSAPSDPQPTEPDKPNHTHNWEPVYATRMVQQYADDGTTNDYSKPITEEKPIYEDRPVYEESPIYETHLFNNGVDVTVAIRNYNAAHGTNYVYEDCYSNSDLNAYLISLGANSNRVYSDQVQVGTERVQVGTERVQVGTETVTVGYEQLGKKEERYISGYRCSCGKTK